MLNIDKKWIVFNKSWYLLHFYQKSDNYTLNVGYSSFNNHLYTLLEDNLSYATRSYDHNGLVRGQD